MKRFPVTPASNIICLIVLAIIFIINLVSAIRNYNNSDNIAYCIISAIIFTIMSFNFL